MSLKGDDEQENSMGVFGRANYGLKKSIRFLRTDVSVFSVLAFTTVIALLVGLSVAFQPLVSNATEGAQTKSSIKPLVAFSGANSHITEQSFRLISDDKEWKVVWARHLGTTPEDAYCPRLAIDFQQCLVIAIFKGKVRNSRGIQLNSIAETVDLITVQFTTLGYQSTLATAKQLPETPFAFIVIPKMAKNIVIEEGVVSKRQPTAAEWKEVARLNH